MCLVRYISHIRWHTRIWYHHGLDKGCWGVSPNSAKEAVTILFALMTTLTTKINTTITTPHPPTHPPKTKHNADKAMITAFLLNRLGLG